MEMLPPTSDRAEILGRDRPRQPVKVHRPAGHVPGKPALYDRLTGRHQVAYSSHLRHRPDGKPTGELATWLDLDLPAKNLPAGTGESLPWSWPRCPAHGSWCSMNPQTALILGSRCSMHSVPDTRLLPVTSCFPSRLWVNWNALRTGLGWHDAGVLAVEKLQDLAARSRTRCVSFAEDISAPDAGLPGLRNLMVHKQYEA